MPDVTEGYTKYVLKLIFKLFDHMSMCTCAQEPEESDSLEQDSQAVVSCPNGFREADSGGGEQLATVEPPLQPRPPQNDG